MKGPILGTSVLVILSLALPAVLGAPPGSGEPTGQASALAAEISAASARVLDEYAGNILMVPAEESEEGSSPEAPATSPNSDGDDDRTDVVPEADPATPEPGAYDPYVAPEQTGLVCAHVGLDDLNGCDPRQLPSHPADGGTPQSPQAPSFTVPLVPTDDEVTAFETKDVDAAPAGLVGVLEALLGPMQQVAREATAAARQAVTTSVATADLMIRQTTHVAEAQIRALQRQVEELSFGITDKFWDLVPGQDSMTTTQLGSEDAGATTTAAASVTPVHTASIALAAVGGAGLLVVAFAVLRRIIGLGSISLLSRIPSKDIMKNDTRAAIFDIVTHDPGVSLNEVVSRLGISRNAVAYHLAVFESEKTVVSIKDGKYRRYFVNGGKYVNGAKDVVSTIKNDVTLGVIQYILAHPGTIQKEVCEAVGTSPSATNWHINRLEKVGLVEKQKVANTVRYSPGPSFTKYDLADFGLAAPVAA